LIVIYSTIKPSNNLYQKRTILKNHQLLQLPSPITIGQSAKVNESEADFHAKKQAN